MKKWVVSLACFVLTLLFVVAPVSAKIYEVSKDEIAGLGLVSEKIYLEDLSTGDVLYAQDADEISAVASLTKIMTASVFLDDFKGKLSDTVTITREMLNIHSAYVVVGYHAGQVVTVEELLYQTLLPSAADAAMALSISDAGDLDGFIEKMNAKAKKLGLKNTHFSNPYGMDEADTLSVWPNVDDASNYSTAREVAVILKDALKNPTFRKVFESSSWTTPDGETIYKTVADTATKNGLDVSRIKGAKTGYTTAAEKCLASISEFDGREFLLINLNAGEKTNHITDATTIYDFVDKKFDYRVVLKAEETVVELPVKWGKNKEKYTVRLVDDVSLYLPVALEKVDIKFEGLDEIFWDTKTGDEIGDVVISANEEELLRTKAVLLDEIEYINYPLITGVIAGVLVGVVVIIVFKKKSKKRK